jgi:hypothetical protein
VENSSVDFWRFSEVSFSSNQGFLRSAEFKFYTMFVLFKISIFFMTVTVFRNLVDSKEISFGSINRKINLV